MPSRVEATEQRVDSLQQKMDLAADAWFNSITSRRFPRGPAGGDSQAGSFLPTDQAIDGFWASSTEIKERYNVGTGQLSKLAKKNPKIRRDATTADRETWKNPKLQYMYDKRLIYELTEGALGAE